MWRADDRRRESFLLANRSNLSNIHSTVAQQQKAETSD